MKATTITTKAPKRAASVTTMTTKRVAPTIEQVAALVAYSKSPEGLQARQEEVDAILVRVTGLRANVDKVFFQAMETVRSVIAEDNLDEVRIAGYAARTRKAYSAAMHGVRALLKADSDCEDSYTDVRDGIDGLLLTMESVVDVPADETEKYERRIKRHYGTAVGALLEVEQFYCRHLDEDEGVTKTEVRS